MGDRQRPNPIGKSQRVGINLGLWQPNGVQSAECSVQGAVGGSNKMREENGGGR